MGEARQDDRETLNSLSFSRLVKIDKLCDDFESAWHSAQQPVIENYLAQAEAPSRTELFGNLLEIELEYRHRAGESPTPDDYHDRFPEYDELVERCLANLREEAADASTLKHERPSTSFSSEYDESLAYASPKSEMWDQPAQIGRYRIERVLGQGGFGVVYLAYDPQLERPIALKVPREQRFQTSQQVASFLQEAHTAARLKHPLLVAVHDIQEQEGLPYIVQEYIDGQNLSDWAATNEPTFERIAQVFVLLAEALTYAHEQGLTHCDLKLANVLMDASEQPHVADFGLAVHESAQALRKGEVFGTPAMMAPEQVRGESHRLDGRTDIWAVGVMLYELLVGRRPFVADNREDLFVEIQAHDPKPPRQIDRNVPRELERICLKCLSKRRTDRYNTADDVRADLVTWLEAEPSTHVPRSSRAVPLPDSSAAVMPPAKIIPKGLRSFDAEDADFFLELLPGPRDRDGLPESIRFWKHRIEESDPDETFPVGLIYGPSGCGKTSLVKAGLLPRLDDQVLPIYIEATAADTETRILKQLHKHVPRLAEESTLAEACAELRQRGAGRERKLLLVIDQFEQWLHGRAELRNCPLVDALRQCDGGRLQAVLMVRDDFFASIHGVFQELEAPLLEGSNYALVDRFDKDHARKVLTAYGRAFGKLDDELSREQEKFVSQAIDELAEEQKVISVRLGLFADMFKNRPWVPASLQEVGGAGGVGVTFLEETFSARTALPSHRVHQQAIRKVLGALLPEAGTGIKGAMRSTDELCVASGYRPQGRQFAELLHILDGELRLITPTDPESVPSEGDSASSTTYYQLTHDYLVPSLQEWLTRKQRETSRGRAELRLAERAAAWQVKPERRQLPNVFEWLSIRILTRSRSWSQTQRKMMRAANHYYLARMGLLALMVLLTWWLAYDLNGRLQARGLTQGLIEAQEDAVPKFADQLKPYLPWARPQLERMAQADSETLDQRQRRLHAQLALVGTDDTYVQDLYESLLLAQPSYFGPIRDLLRPYQTRLLANLWAQLHDPVASADRRFRAGLALADYAPDSDQWAGDDFAFLVQQLIAANPDDQVRLRKYIYPIHERLLSDLQRLCLDPQLSESHLLGAANALADFARDSPSALERVLSEATPLQFPTVLLPIYEALHPTEPQPFADLWTEFHDPAASVDGRFRAGLALAANVSESDQWTREDFAFLADRLLAANPDHQMRLRSHLRPVREYLLPLLEQICLDSLLSETQLLGATNAVADLARDDAIRLARILSEVTPKQYAILFPVLDELRDPGGDSYLQQVVAEQPAEELPPLDRVPLGKRAAGAAITLLRLGARQEVLDALRVDDDPESLTQFVHRLRARGPSVQEVLECLRLADQDRQYKPLGERAIEDRVMCGLLLTMGEYPLEGLSPEARDLLITDLGNWYATDPSSAIHGAAGWLLRHWGLEEIARQVDETLVPYSPGREWFTMRIVTEAQDRNSAGQKPAAGAFRPQTLFFTFVVFPAGEYEIGSPEGEPYRREEVEQRRRVTITRPFALLDRELTFAEFNAFDDGPHEIATGGFSGRDWVTKDHSYITPQHPATCINWYDSVRFCRWLTAQRGWAEQDQPYPDPESLEELDGEEFPLEPDVPAGGAPRNWPLYLERPGFRLPTAAEWEIACRAGTRSTYGFGCDKELLQHYCWFKGSGENEIHSVRTRRPNLAGLFDMHGNVLEWCHDWLGVHEADNLTDPLQPSSFIVRYGGAKAVAMRRVAGGGCWRYSSWHCRSAYKGGERPTHDFDRLGIRPALTIVP